MNKPKYKADPPYEECDSCKDLGDCRHLEIANNLLGTPLPPDNCPKYNDVMRATVAKIKRLRDAK